MRESNKIEGEVEYWHNEENYKYTIGLINPGDIDSAQKFLLLKKVTPKGLLTAHKKMFSHRMDDAGIYRLYDVMVGKYRAPAWEEVSGLMTNFFKDLPYLDSWMAHNRFEKIHPFGDGNGRIGRLLWLHKALKEGYNFGIPFLHQYYYQTLQHYQQE